MPPGARPAYDALSASLEHWSECWRFAAALGGVSLEGMRLFLDPRRLRERWLAELSCQMDVYLRSPVFLEFMGLNFKLMARTRRFVLPPSRD